MRFRRWDLIIECVARFMVGILVVYQYAQIDFSCMSMVNLIGVLMMIWITLPVFKFIELTFEKKEARG